MWYLDWKNISLMPCSHCCQWFVKKRIPNDNLNIIGTAGNKTVKGSRKEMYPQFPVHSPRIDNKPRQIEAFHSEKLCCIKNWDHNVIMIGAYVPLSFHSRQLTHPPCPVSSASNPILRTKSGVTWYVRWYPILETSCWEEICAGNKLTRARFLTESESSFIAFPPLQKGNTTEASKGNPCCSKTKRVVLWNASQ